MQQTQFNTPAAFNEAMRLAHLNDNTHGILSNIYDDEYPHPYFDPEQIGFYRYRNYNHCAYTDRSTLPNKSIVFEDFEMYIPGIGDLDHKLTYDIGQCPLTKHDYVITACITKNDHMWPVPYVYNNYHFVQTHTVNKLQRFDRLDVRPYFADVLLGNSKPHRTLFFKLLRATDMLDKCIINLFGVYKSKFLENITDTVQQTINNTTNKDDYANTTSNLDGGFVSQHISKPIMNASWISVVSETICNNDCFFLTEKTAKPLMAGRPFIMLSGKHTLKNLRSLGFKTFSPVIDESYDDIENQNERIMAAFESFQSLEQLDQVQVRNQLQDVLTHNQQLMYSKKSLTQRARDFLDNIRLD